MLDLAVWRDWDREPLEFARVHTLNALGAGEAAAKWEAAFPHGTPPARIWVPADLDARLRRQWISVGPVFDLGVKDSPAYIKASAALDDVLAGSAEWQRWWDNADRPALELFAVYSDKIQATTDSAAIGTTRFGVLRRWSERSSASTLSGAWARATINWRSTRVRTC